MSRAAVIEGAGPVHDVLALDAAGFDARLDQAARGRGIAFVVLSAPVVDPAQLIDAWRDAPAVAWVSPELRSSEDQDGKGRAKLDLRSSEDQDGKGRAKLDLRSSEDQDGKARAKLELRSSEDQDGKGRAKLAIAGVGVARELRGTGAGRWDQVVAQARALPIGAAIAGGAPVGLDALGPARPRLLGGAAFTPGAADGAPWLGFGDAWFVLPRWSYVHDGARGWLVLAVDPGEARDAARWRGELAIHRAAFAAGAVGRAQPAVVELQRAGADEWRGQIEAITSAIARGELAKVVAARTCKVALAGPVRAAGLLAALGERHADCVRLMIRPPGAGALIAATPERLVRRDGDVVHCDALAGTTSAGAAGRDGAALARAAEALLASGKDRREHDLVVTAIRAALEDAGAIVDAPGEPAVRALRHVVHLHTPFRATLRGPRHLLELAARLHPTPAMGGTPTAAAVAWIGAREPAPRGWYSAPVGWFDLDGNGELAVAIRAGVVAGSRVHLWAGAGIVAGSDPDRELAETELKLRAMLGALGVAP